MIKRNLHKSGHLTGQPALLFPRPCRMARPGFLLPIHLHNMEKIENKPVYKCSHCGKLSLSLEGMTRHEKLCKKNPENWTNCASCVYLDRISVKIEGTSGERCESCPHYDWDAGCDREYCDGSQYTTDFICKKTGKRMYYRRKILAMPKAKAEEIIKRCECAMPCECEIIREENKQAEKQFDDIFSWFKVN